LFTLVPLSFLADTTQQQTKKLKNRREESRRVRPRVAKSKNPHFWFPGRRLGISISSLTHTEPDQNGTPDAKQQPNGHSPMPGICWGASN